MKLNSRLAAFTAVVSALTVVLSFLTIPFLLGTRIHFFQAGIMLAGVVGGPLGGLIAGSIGGLYVAIARSDATIVVGNGLLGLFTGVFSRKVRPVLAGLTAWLFVQAPWIYFTGTYILRVPTAALQLILVLLTIEDLISASVTDVLVNRFRLRNFFVSEATRS